MRALFVTATILLLSSQAVMAANPISWGKAGVSYDQYRDDAKNCTLVGLDAELTQKPPPFWASGVNDTLDTFLQRADSGRVAMVRLETESATAVIRTCLIRQGYHRFQLTDAQSDHLQTLARGSEARHQYLYSLGHDTAVLASQAVPDDVK